jgi:protein-S-isoprenylcysteine O-methyltransferase Ste14
MATWKQFAQKTRVPAGTALGILFLLLMHPSVRSLWIGAVITAPGCLLRFWAAGHIDKGRALTQGGPYAMTRNPLYLGSFFMALGIILGGQGYWLLPLFGGFFAAFYIPVMKAEADGLLRVYGQEFIEYSKRVPAFFPSFQKARPGNSTFSWSRVVRNREHRNVIGLFVAQAILVLKFILQ